MKFKSNSGLSQNKNICTQVIANLNRLVEIYALSDPTYNYSQNENVLFFREKNDNKEEISFSTYRINKFTEELTNL